MTQACFIVKAAAGQALAVRLFRGVSVRSPSGGELAYQGRVQAFDGRGEVPGDF